MKTYEATEQAYKNGYAKGYEEGKRDACPEGGSPAPKIKTHFAMVIAEGPAECPCYSILFLDPRDRRYHIGYSSYERKIVFGWLQEIFEVDDDDFERSDPIKHGRWINRYDDEDEDPLYECSECKTTATYKAEVNERGHLQIVQALTDYCPHCGADMRG